MSAGRNDGIDVLVLGAVPDEDHTVRLYLLEDLGQLGDQCQIGAVADLLVAAYEGDIGLVAVLLELEADAYSRIEGVEVRILRIGDTEGGGGIEAVLHTDNWCVDLSLDAEVVVPVDDQDQSLAHGAWIPFVLEKPHTDTLPMRCVGRRQVNRQNPYPGPWTSMSQDAWSAADRYGIWRGSV